MESKKTGPGYVVKTQSGKRGRTYHSDQVINNKIQVYCDDGTKLLCSVTEINVIGYAE